MITKKKILIHSIAFSPDCVSTAYLYNDIANGFKENGFEVIVLTTTPHYNIVKGEIEKQPLRRKWLGIYYESYYNGIKVFHVPQKKFKSSFLRMIGFIYWHIISTFLGLAQKNISAILSPSPPLTIGAVNLLIAKLKRAKVIYNVQEIYPDFLIEQGGLKSGFVIKILKMLEKFVYNQSDAVTTIDDIFYKAIIGRFNNKSKLHIIPNFVDTKLYKPLEKTNLDSKLFLKNDHLKLMYAGNIGHAQDWQPFLQAAIQLRNDPIDFYVIGEGVMKRYVEENVLKYKLSNVHILPYQPREKMPQLLAFADLQFIFMSKEMEEHGFPSKVYTIMACAKPLLVCSGFNTPIVNFLKDHNCSKIIAGGDIEEITNEIVGFLRSISKIELNEMGQKGLNVITKHYSKEVVVMKYISLVTKLID